MQCIMQRFGIVYSCNKIDTICRRKDESARETDTIKSYQ